ncbi:YceD family protein [Georgenia muralis]|uniref:Metal-binding protein n=1 Tax=Georgenia muralis TaxID=154117 RepID=A0A3N4ZJ73_9MICO|nr:YceD family protein [Georgenia muralis]RPF25632.1 uncharacterized protein EDD32_0033 [Georgenia muralis]
MDPRSPLVVSTHDLGRRAGAMRTLRTSVPAPADMGTEVIGVPLGAELDLDLTLQAVADGVLVTGTAAAPLHGECVRCLRDVDSSITVDVSELYYYEGRKAALTEEGDEEAEDLPELEGELLDLEPTVRDAVVLALPFQPLCRADCAGLCPHCGVRLDDAEPGHHHEELDPRWAALGSLFAENEGSDPEGGEEAR